MPTTSTKKIDVSPIPKRELLAYSAEVKYEIYRQIRKRFHELKALCGFDQIHLAKRLDVDKSLVSRRLRGENDMQLETLSDLARGLDCRIDVRLTPLAEVDEGLAPQWPYKDESAIVWGGVHVLDEDEDDSSKNRVKGDVETNSNVIHAR